MKTPSTSTPRSSLRTASMMRLSSFGRRRTSPRGFYRRQFEGTGRDMKLRVPGRLFNSPVHDDRLRSVGAWLRAALSSGHRDALTESLWRINAVLYYSHEADNGGLAQFFDSRTARR